MVQIKLKSINFSLRVTDKRFLFFLIQQPHCSSSLATTPFFTTTPLFLSSQLAVETSLSGETPFAAIYHHRRYYPLSIPSAVSCRFHPFQFYHKPSQFLRRTQHHRSIIKRCKGDIHTSKVKYILRRGQPYLWVPENDLHNMNTIIDERGSFAVTSPFPGRLGSILKSLKKLPARVALSGDVLPLKEDKAKSLVEKLHEVILSEQKATKEFSYTVSGVLSSGGSGTSRSDNLQELMADTEKYSIYKFKTRSCTFIDAHGSTFDVDVEDLGKSKADLLAPFSAKLIDGINQSEARRRALVLLCFVYMNANAKDAYMTSVDRKGFDVLAKVTGPVSNDGVGEYLWKEFRFMFEKEANDVEMFCNQLVEMEQEVINKVSAASGLN